VRVQGDTSAAEVAAAIRGFNALEPGGKIPRPDVLIVARGGGSIEDLWGFNEEIVVRAAAESGIPLVSPVANVARMRARLDAVGPRPYNAVCRSVVLRTETLKQIGTRLVVSREALLRAERLRVARAGDAMKSVAERLGPALEGQIARKAKQLEAVSKLFDSLNYKSVLKRGFALVRDMGGQPLNSAEAVLDGQALVLEFADGRAEATGGRIGSRPRVTKPKIMAVEEQGALF